MFGFHAPELIIILVVALLIFGPKKLPEMGSAIGKSIKEFQKGMRDLTSPKEAKEEESEPTVDDREALDRQIATKKAQLDMIDRELASRTATNEVSNSETETPAE
jgi:sec-independent protein translocase protein TatA